MEKKINAYGVKISLEDIKQFLKNVGGFDKINSVYMGILINRDRNQRQKIKIGDIPEGKKELTIQSDTNKTIDELNIIFYKLNKYDKPISYARLILTLCKNDKEELYFAYENGNTEIRVDQVKKINAYGIKISLEDIKQFLKDIGGFDKIDPIHMEISINGNVKKETKIGDIPEGKKELAIQSDTSETIDELKIIFYKLNKYDEPIKYEKLDLTLCKNDEEKLYFVYENGNTEIKVDQVKKMEKNKNNNFESDREEKFNPYTISDWVKLLFFVAKDFNFKSTKENSFESAKDFNFKSTKENSFAFSHSIFFGQKIDYLVYAIFKKNKEFIDFNDAEINFQYLFCIKSGDVWIKSGCLNTAHINNFYDIVFFNHDNVKIDKLKIFIRHENYKNFLKDKKYGENIPDNNIDLNELRSRGFYEIDVKENENKTGFKHKLVDCNGNLISYAVNHDKKTEVRRLRDYLSDTCENSEFKKLMERFNLAWQSGDCVLKDIVEGIYLTEVVRERECVFLGTKTKLVFTKEFLEGLKNVDKSDSKFYVLPQSRALRDIVDFILRGKCLPFKNLFFINEEIAKSYDTKKRIDKNLDGKDMTTLRIYNLEIDPNLQSDKFSDDLTRLCEIDDGLKCAGSLIKLLSEIKVPDSYFGYRLSSFKNGELILKTNDIFQIPEQNLREKFAFGDCIFFGERIGHLIYAVSINNKDFINFDDAQAKFKYLFCIKRGNVWSMRQEQTDIREDIDYVYLENNDNVKIDELKIFIRHENYKNFLKDKKYGRNILDNNIDLNELRSRGFYEIDVKENENKTGFKYKLVGRNGNTTSCAIDYGDNKEEQRFTNYLSNIYEDDKYKNFTERLDSARRNRDCVLKDIAEGIYLTDKVCECVCLGTKTKLVFTEEFLDKLEEVGKFNKNKFYILPKSQALKDIVDFILRKKCLPFKSLYFINEEIAKSYDTKKHIDKNLDGKDMTTLRIYNPKIDPNLQSDKFSDDLAKLCQIDDGFQCAVALIELLLKIQAPNSHFKYQLNSVKDGKSILETHDISQTDISKILGQIKNNTEGKTSWLEVKKAQASELQKTNKGSGIQIIRIPVVDLKKFLSNNGIEQKDFKEICMRSFIGKLLNKDENNGNINIGNLEDSSYIYIECGKNSYMCKFKCMLTFTKNDVTLINLTLKLVLIDDSYCLQYVKGKKREKKIDIRVEKSCIDYMQKTSTESQESNITQRPREENINDNSEPSPEL